MVLSGICGVVIFKSTNFNIDSANPSNNSLTYKFSLAEVSIYYTPRLLARIYPVSLEIFIITFRINK